MMTKFLFSHEKQIDAKGRVSVPAPYRTSLAELGGERIFCFPALDPDTNALECYPSTGYLELLARIEEVEDPEERDQLEWAVITRGIELNCDAEGRVAFPERFLTALGIDKMIRFAARGDRFQIMSPETYERIDGGVGANLVKLRRHLSKSPRAAVKAEVAS